jgi:hypothetical protein
MAYLTYRQVGILNAVVGYLSVLLRIRGGSWDKILAETKAPPPQAKAEKIPQLNYDHFVSNNRSRTILSLPPSFSNLLTM